MKPASEFTDSQKHLLAGRKSYFFESCLKEFEFLLGVGFRWSIEDLGRFCYLVSFKKEDASDGFTVRIYHEDDDLLWCDLVCVSNDEFRVRLAGRSELLEVTAPLERLPPGPVQKAVQTRVRELAELIKARWPDFRARLLSSLRSKKASTS
jgi:hypothetical protein